MLSTTVTKTVKPFETIQMKLQTKTGGNLTPQMLLDKAGRGKGPTHQIKKIDPLRALEPTRKKLTTIEAQRIMAVLVETIRRTELVGILPYIIDNVDRFSVMLGSELVQMLQDHNIMMSSFRELKADTERLIELDNERRREKALHLFELHDNNDDDDVNREREEETAEDDDGHQDDDNEDDGAALLDDADRPMSMNSISEQTEAAMRQMMLVARQMQNSCKNILRAFSANPSAVTAILKEMANPEVMKNMLGDMAELRLIIMGRLLTTPVEEMERNEYLKVIMQRERSNAALIAKLEAELDTAIADKNEEIRKKNDVIRKLQSDLHHIEKYSDELIRRTRTDADKQEAADVKNSEGKRQKLHVEAQQLKASLGSLTEEHRNSEGQLRKKRYKVETECENWIQKYDNDMGDRQDEYEMIDGVYTEEKKQLNELEERFKTLEEEYKQIMEERRIAQEKREEAEKKLRTSMKAATTIQAFWRSFKVRKALKTKKKGKKGKKGKK